MTPSGGVIIRASGDPAGSHYRLIVHTLTNPKNQKLAKMLFSGYNYFGAQRQVVMRELTQNG